MFASPSVHYERRTHKDAGDPQPPEMRMYSNRVKGHTGKFDPPLSPIDSIGMYQKPSQMMLPLNEVNDGRDASQYGIGRMFSTSVSAKPLSQFDKQVFNPRDAYGRYGADIKLATHK